MRFEDVYEKEEIKENALSSVGRPAVKSAAEIKPYAEPVPGTMNLSILQDNLGHCLNIIDDEVMKGYVTRLDQLPVIPPETCLDHEINDIHFFRISELVYQEDEFSVDKLAMVFHALSNKPCTLVLMLKSDGEKTEFYLGARPVGLNSAGTLFQMLRQTLLGFFPGSCITEYYDEDMQKDMEALKVGCISSVTCIADYKQKEDAVSNKEFIQGLEKFVYAMRGKNYTAVFIADSVGQGELMQRKREYEQIYTQISPFANMQMNFAVSDSESASTGNSEGTTRNVSKTETRGISETRTDTKTDTSTTTVGSSRTSGTMDTGSRTHTVSDSVANGRTHTRGTSESSSHTETNSVYAGGSGGLFGLGVNAGYSHSSSDTTSHTESVSDSVSKTLTHGLSDAKGYSHGDSKTWGTNESESASTGRSISAGTGSSESASHTSGEAFNLVNTTTMTETFGTSKAVTLNARNMTLELTLQRIAKHLERIEECESFGMWNFASYFLGETAAEAETAANTYKSVIAGTDSGIERSAINSWTNAEVVKNILSYVSRFVHPQFQYRRFSYDRDCDLSVNPSVLVSTNELAIHMGLPRHSVRGLAVVEHAQFAPEVITRAVSGGGSIRLGHIYNFGQVTNTLMPLDINSLTMHTFITGSTGSGKSNTVYQMLNKLRSEGVTFLVVEPAKGEYKTALGIYRDVKVFGTNPNMEDMQMLRINPFRFPKHTHILEHLDRLVEIFNVCWPMYAAMPAILKDSVERAYIACGWDLEKSINRYDAELFPAFSDVVSQIKIVLNESDYSADNKGDYTGSLVTRLKSLTNGINGLIFNADDIRDRELFDRNTIVDLSRVGSSETKSLVMGLLVLKLQEYRMEQRSTGANTNDDLKHVTVLEEAHHLLKRTSIEQSNEGANMQGKSVEMLANSIAEMRTYGEGFVIADQAPGLLDMSVIRNTNTKIILRLPDFSDRELVGKAAGLNDSQIVELAKLEKGVAAIYQNDWSEPILCKVDRFDDSGRFELSDSKEEAATVAVDHIKVEQSLLECIMNREIYRRGDRGGLQKLRQDILRSRLSISVKCEFMEYLNAESGTALKSLRTLIYDFFHAGEAIDQSRKYSSIREWANAVVDALQPDVRGYSRKQIDLLLGLIVNEQALRDTDYRELFCRFTEIYRREGRLL